jgi:hypothetical protein
MNSVVDRHQAFHRGTDRIFEILTSDQVCALAAFEPDARLAERIACLGELANERRLTDAERYEYEAYIEANDLVAILKAEAQYRLSAGGN